MKFLLTLGLFTALSTAVAHDASTYSISAKKPPLQLHFIGALTLPKDATFDGTPVNELSGIDYLPDSDKYVVITDDRAESDQPRFYTLDLDFDENTANSVNIEQVVRFSDAQGKPFETGSVDPEGIRIRDNRVFWSSEGKNKKADVIAPFVWESDFNGKFIRAFAVPSKYLPVVGKKVGVGNNRAFESLTLHDNHLYTATEGTLLQDGDHATLTTAGLSRVLGFDLQTGAAVSEFLYVTDPIARSTKAANGWMDAGVTDLLALDDKLFLVIERAYADGVGFTIKLYLADAAPATNLIAIDSVQGKNVNPMEKRLVLDFRDLGDINGKPVDNIEGVTFGKVLNNGKKSLVFVSDNNDDAQQTTQFLFFAVE